MRVLGGPLDLADRLEKSKAMDKPIQRLAKAVRDRIRPGLLRDVLHGVPTGKPLHPPLATVSLGCWASAGVLDLTTIDPRAARLLLAVGIGNALPTAAAGLTDWSSLHREQQRVGFVHMLANVTALGLFTASLATRVAGRERVGRVLSWTGLGVGRKSLEAVGVRAVDYFSESVFEDGGYALIALRRLRKEFFQGIDWGGSNVYAQTVKKLNGYRWRALRTVRDVDRPEDLERIRWLRLPSASPRGALR